jgi:hypothetical protein
MNQLTLFPSSSPLIGTVVYLDRSIDRRRPCHSNTATITAGTETHAAGLACVDCGTHRGWLKRTTVASLNKIIETFGPFDAPITIRDASSEYFNNATDF